MAERFWTVERVAELNKLWREGRSCTEIAKTMHAKSRMAVIGKLHRMGLSRRDKPSEPAKVTRPKAPPQPPKPHLVRPQPDPGHAERRRVIREATARGERVGGFLPGANVPVPPNNNPTTLLALTDAVCKWPINDPEDAADTLFCGAPAACRPYCAHHDRWARTPATTSASQLERSLRRYVA